MWNSFYGPGKNSIILLRHFVKIKHKSAMVKKSATDYEKQKAYERDREKRKW